MGEPSTVIRSLLGSIAYFFVARTLFRTADDAKALLRALAIAGILIAGFVSYFVSYAQVIQDTLARMEAERPGLARPHGDADAAARSRGTRRRCGRG